MVQGHQDRPVFHRAEEVATTRLPEVRGLKAKLADMAEHVARLKLRDDKGQELLSLFLTKDAEKPVNGQSNLKCPIAAILSLTALDFVPAGSILGAIE